MNSVWNLDVLYKGFEDENYGKDMARFQSLVEKFNSFAKNLSQCTDAKAALVEGLTMEEELHDLVGKMAGYANLRQAANTKDQEAGSKMGQILGIYSGLAGATAAFEQWASNLPDLMELVEQDETLKSYKFLISNLKENSRHLLPGMGEEILAKMEISGSEAWSDLQSYVTSTVPVHYNGGVTNLSAIRNMAYDADPQVRNAAYEAEIACYKQIEAPVAFALNSIKLETLTDCQLRGHTSPLDRTLEKAHMERATLEAMLEAMQEYMPHFRRYLRAKAKALGHEGGLPWYDLFAPMGGNSSKWTTQQTRDYLVNLFAGFDKELSDMVAEAFDNEWIDFYPRDGKRGGAFCSSIRSIGQSRILTNFDGTFSDVVTLAHELGHAFHNRCIRDHRPLNHGYSMPVAETASTFNECVVMAAAIQDAKDPGEKLALIESQLQDATQIICDIYSRFLFEKSVFENRPTQFMHADRLCQLMTEAQKQSYGEGLDEQVMHPYMWVCKSHYYGPTFYNVPYAFGGLFARGLYARYEQEGPSFVPKYKKLLYTTTIANAEDVAKVADIDLTDKNFWRGGLQMIVDQIDLFCSLIEE